VDRLVAKLRDFLAWLVKRGPVKGVTLSGLHELWAAGKVQGSRFKVDGSDGKNSFDWGCSTYNQAQARRLCHQAL
jgi:hypothetical protein